MENIYNLELTGEALEKAKEELVKYYKEVQFDDYTGLEKTTKVGLMIFLGIWEHKGKDFYNQLIEVNDLYVTVSQFLETLESNDYADENDFEYIKDHKQNRYIVNDTDMNRLFVVRNL